MLEPSSLKAGLRQGILPLLPSGGATRFTFHKGLVWDSFPKLSLHTQVSIAVVPHFIGNTFGEVSITRELTWIESLFHIHKREKEVNVPDRAMASQRNPHSKGGAPGQKGVAHV